MWESSEQMVRQNVLVEETSMESLPVVGLEAESILRLEQSMTTVHCWTLALLLQALQAVQLMARQELLIWASAMMEQILVRRDSSELSFQCMLQFYSCSRSPSGVML
jgi:hypothetical protein